MQELKKLVEKYKQLCVLLGIFGLLLSPFLWPFFLAILLNSLSLALPVLVVYTIVECKRKEKKDEYEKDREQNYTGHVNGDATDAEQKKCEECKTDEKKDSVPKKEQKRSKPVSSKKDRPKEDLDEESCAALSWYQMEGRERIFRLMKRLEGQNIFAFSVTPEGICTVKEENGFRRVGVLRAFPRHKIWVIEHEIWKDGIRTNTNGKYLWLSWGKKVSK